MDSLLDHFLLECWRTVWRAFVASVSLTFVLGVVLGQLLAWGVCVLLMAGLYTLIMWYLDKRWARKWRTRLENLP
jgi:Flp pilus assembly protein TadB